MSDQDKITEDEQIVDATENKRYEEVKDERDSITIDEDIVAENKSPIKKNKAEVNTSRTVKIE